MPDGNSLLWPMPERLLDLELCGRRVVPGYLGEEDLPWVAGLLERARGCVGRTRTAVEAALSRPPGPGARPARWEAATHLVLGLWGFDLRGLPLPPATLRATLFEAAARASVEERAAVLDRVARGLGLAPEALLRDLYADLPEERVLAAGPELTAAELVRRYNLALAQGLLMRTESLEVTLSSHITTVLRFARLRRLLCLAQALPGCGARVQLSGPLSLFHHTTKYGRAMAAWLPVLARAPDWHLSATCVLHGERWHWQASHADPLAPPGPLRPFDSKLEAAFARDLARQAPGWQLLREADPVQIGRSIVCPDFTLVDPARGLRVPVEVVGFWTPEYLAHKLAVLRRLPAGQRWLVCIDETLAGRDQAEAVLPGEAFRFRRRIDVEAFLAFLERWV
jgi:predicted nuclease of restriction endonuclease-like RecB superfamily